MSAADAQVARWLCLVAGPWSPGLLAERWGQATDPERAMAGYRAQMLAEAVDLAGGAPTGGVRPAAFVRAAVQLRQSQEAGGRVTAATRVRHCRRAGCEAPAVARQLCRSHYDAIRAGRPTPEDRERQAAERERVGGSPEGDGA